MRARRRLRREQLAWQRGGAAATTASATWPSARGSPPSRRMIAGARSRATCSTRALTWQRCRRCSGTRARRRRRATIAAASARCARWPSACNPLAQVQSGTSMSRYLVHQRADAGETLRAVTAKRFVARLAARCGARPPDLRPSGAGSSALNSNPPAPSSPLDPICAIACGGSGGRSCNLDSVLAMYPGSSTAGK